MLPITTNFDGRSGEEEINKNISKNIRWWEKVLDLEEAKTQVLFSLPMILTNVFYYLLALISVMFAGHLGQLQFAGATLANSWASVSGFTFMLGLSGALETFCGQNFGAKLYKVMGIHLQASCIICFCFAAALSLFWFYTEPILISLHQDPHISATAALYMKYLIPGLFSYGFLQNILRFLQTQSIVWPIVICSFITICIHIGMAYCLVHLTPLGFKGAALALSISLWISVFMLGSYVIRAKKLKHTWTGFSCESFSFILINLKLALPSAGMVCFEHWAFEILVLLAGLMPNSQITTPLLAMCVSTSSVAYMLTYGLGAAASTRVSNELGAGQVDRAKNAMVVTLKLSVFVIIVAIAALGFGHNAWAGFFNDSIIIKKEFASMVPFLAASIAVDAVQGVLLGVTRGCGWQHLIVYTNLATYYLIGIPIACLLGLKLKLYAKGLWVGLICGICCQTITLLIIAIRKKWDKAIVSTYEQEKNSS